MRLKMVAEITRLSVRGGLPRETGYEALPPREYWLEDIKKLKIESPVDERGIVDPRTVVEIGKSLIDPEFAWPSNLSIHHLYWERWWYGLPSAGSQALSFRELPIHKILVPRVFENLLHKVMVPPGIPSQEVMEKRIESWGIAKSLFKSVRNVVRWENNTNRYIAAVANDGLPKGYETEDTIGKELLGDIVNRHFQGIEMHMERLHAVAPEFRLVEPEEEVIASPLRRREYSKELGRVVVPRALPMLRQLRAA
jgi:hypothetical protein